MSEPSAECGRCRHWHRHAPDPTNLAAKPKGECREGPPAVFAFAVPTRPGLIQAQIQTLYPHVDCDFPACGHFAPRLVTDS